MGMGLNLTRTQELERSLVLRNLHTGERVKTTFWAEGEYDIDALRGINKLLRDHRNDKVAVMDIQLLENLHKLYQMTGSRREIEIISGYRSPETNEMLRRQGRKVAKRSMHTQAKAIDIRLHDVELSYLQKAALSIGAGGVGYYPKSNFVHIDVGRVRQW